MTRNDIIRMAREAGFSQPWTAPKETQERLARFAALIAAAERKTRALEQEPVAWVKHDGEIVVRTDYGGRLYYSEQNIYTADVVREAVEAEREACAIAGGAAAMAGFDHVQVADAIRARKQS